MLMLGGLYLSIYLSIYQKALVAPNDKGTQYLQIRAYGFPMRLLM